MKLYGYTMIGSDEMFNLLTDAIENAFDVVEDLFEGNLSKRKVAKLISDGLTVGAIAHGFGVAEDVIEALLEKE